MCSFVWIDLLCPFWGLGVSCGQNWPSKHQQLAKILESSRGDHLRVPTQVAIVDIAWRPVRPGSCKRAGTNSTNVALIVAVKVRALGERIFTSAAMVHITKGMSWGHCPRLPLIFVNIIISLLVISRIIFYRKHFWPPGSLFSDGGSTLDSLPKLYAWRCIHLRPTERWNLCQSQTGPIRTFKVAQSIFGTQQKPRCLE